MDTIEKKLWQLILPLQFDQNLINLAEKLGYVLPADFDNQREMFEANPDYHRFLAEKLLSRAILEETNPDLKAYMITLSKAVYHGQISGLGEAENKMFGELIRIDLPGNEASYKRIFLALALHYDYCCDKELLKIIINMPCLENKKL